MITPYYQDEQVTLHHGDCLDVLRADDYGYDWNLGYRSARMFPDCSVDAVITDPPYGIAFMGKDWDQPGAFGSERRNGSPQRTQREGLAMDAGRYDLSPAAMLNFQRWCTAWATECLRILKPGGHLLAFGGSRTWHRLAAGIEDAGFEIRDSIAWLYGSGFPKSLDVSKAIDKAAGAEREVVGTHHRHGGGSAVSGSMSGLLGTDSELPLTAPATVAAKQWQGWGTALKPSFEPIVVARKPLAGTVAANVLEHGTGALNIDACRIPTGDKLGGGSTTRGQRMKDGWHRPWMDDPDMVAANAERSRASVARSEELGRWPTNVVLDEHQAEALDRQTGVLHSGTMRAGTDRQPRAGGTIYGADTRTFAPADTYGDSGGASRFFPVFRYEAKAPTSERPNADGVQHPTVKPLDLMRWLVRLVAPVGAVVLEPFAGSGTTAEACVLEDRQCIAIEREADYLPLIVSRLQKPVQAGLFGLEAGA
ncbi:site-specific DNA-methyltransferase [Mycobacteroides abscessus subsp. abscessus]|uniref:DNA-methyltransferase n=1 Tax=Mycobacteroides abscessus TaxID=36809 RepID=UPI0009A8386D|nr:site-specific DNA-methyltransferase [Mycobacteroides abscessus]MDM2600714.1 site-specific DNA-methyltransferase [Mycobacteroides abscessus]MDM2612837.1 site-specific DNA-methyltransferase [Mycobacteroides abscessus]MDM2617769.1 site-specific DNA-methyltransferase [Mycobacteroides abscessus]MDM2622640.1 site-specific DNA-methyltransferase [Mycobacteroides abscessus]MDM2627531.1 site-specific DNA-methyltransferase [Mycobacteroides abscessus]